MKQKKMLLHKICFVETDCLPRISTATIEEAEKNFDSSEFLRNYVCAPGRGFEKRRKRGASEQAQEIEFVHLTFASCGAGDRHCFYSSPASSFLAFADDGH